MADAGHGRSLRHPGVRTWLRLMRVYQQLDRTATEQLRAYGLSVAQFYVLTHVGADEGLVQQELADGLLVTKGNVVQLLDRLEERGLLERRREGRTNRLYLTAAGRALQDEVVPLHEAAIAARFGALGPTEQRQLLGLLRKLERSLRRES